MAGEGTSPDDKLDQMIASLEEDMVRRGLIIIDKPEVDAYMSISQEEMASLPPDELGSLAFSLSQYSYYIQTMLNWLNVRIKMCQRYAVSDHKNAKRWRELQEKAEQRFDTLYFIPARIQDIMKAAFELQQSRRRTHGKI
jgi:hypothetical protein